MEVIGKKKPDLVLRDKSFSLDNTREYTHRIFINKSEVSGIIYKGDNQILSVYNIDLGPKKGEDLSVKKINNIFLKKNWFNPPYKKTDIYYLGGRFTMVPEKYFDTSNIESYFNFNAKIRDNETLAWGEIPDSDICFIYSMPKELKTLLESRFTNLYLGHFAFLQLPYYLNESLDSQASVYLYIHKGSFQIFIIEKNKLILYNEFEYETKEDFLYYVIFCMEQTQLNPEFNSVFISGEINTEDEKSTLLSNYVRNVKILSNNTKLHNNDITSKLISHKHLLQLISQ